MIQRPSYYNPVRYPERAKERRDLVLQLMRESGSLPVAEYERRSNPLCGSQNRRRTILPRHTSWPGPGRAAGETAGQHAATRYVATTLDPELQQAAEEAVRAGMENVDRQLKRKNNGAQRPQVALIALDPRTGQIRALVGGRSYADSQLNHALAQRQPARYQALRLHRGSR
jgi:penicillin-binding protein 1B